MEISFYEYMMRHVNHDAKDPLSRLANTIHGDLGFPKQSKDFKEITTYLEGSLDYGKLLVVFDDAWQSYQFDIL